MARISTLFPIFLLASFKSVVAFLPEAVHDDDDYGDVYMPAFITLVGATIWVLTTIFVKGLASSFEIKFYFDRVHASIFHQYVLRALSGNSRIENVGNDRVRGSGREFGFNKMRIGKRKKEKIYACEMKKLIRKSRLSWGLKPRVIRNEQEARDAANQIFTKVAKHDSRYIYQEDLLLCMPQEEVEIVFPLFEGAAWSRCIKKSMFRNWVVKAFKGRKRLVISLNNVKTTIKKLTQIVSGVVLFLIAMIWLFLMGITATRFLVFIVFLVLLVIYTFVSTALKGMIFVFKLHPFDIGDRCVIDGVQMTVDEMSILMTTFVKPDTKKVYFKNAFLATKPIVNFNRMPEMMGDAVEFAVDSSTSVESITALRAKIKEYLASKPHHWSPNYSVLTREIVENKKIMVLDVTHTINFQDFEKIEHRRADLMFHLKTLFEELGISCNRISFAPP